MAYGCWYFFSIIGLPFFRCWFCLVVHGYLSLELNEMSAHSRVWSDVVQKRSSLKDHVYTYFALFNSIIAREILLSIASRSLVQEGSMPCQSKSARITYTKL